MNQREQQREETRDRIVAAAVECFSERGFRAASTREIATRAGTNQGLITYHFRSKDDLWKAAADRIFGQLRRAIAALAPTLEGLDPRERAREGIRQFVRFAAAHPELFRFMLEEGKNDDERLQWLIDHHLRPLDDVLPEFGDGAGGPLRPHLRYILVGAGSVIFSVAPECRRLTGLDPTRPEAIETHANVLARLLVP
ncbi:MAG: TetR/AcrR family transcriptional regulator [Myxococcota bacterium]